jgi:hypothetical protein
MKNLVIELLNRGWDFRFEDCSLYVILGINEYIVDNDEEAEKVLEEIRKYW